MSLSHNSPRPFGRTRLNLREVVSVGRLMQGELNSESRYFRHFSGHDVTLRPLLIAMGLFDGRVPHYAARITFQLYQVPNGVHKTVRTPKTAF